VPRRRLLAIPAAGLAGAALPTCECTSVPIAGRMIATGFPTSAALTFPLSAPAINGRPTAGIAATAVTAIPAPAEPYELP
jgi:uncharacterized protein